MQKLTLCCLNLICLLFLFLTIFVTPSFADDITELTARLQQKQDEIAKLEKQLDETIKQEKTLKTQLTIIDNQTKITELKIEETTLKIQKLGQEIIDLSGRITRISTTVDSLSATLLNRIVKTYKYGSVDGLQLLLSSNGFTDILEKLKYIQVVQANDKKVLYQLQATKAAYDDQKQDKQTRQTEAERLNLQLENYKTQLAQQKSDKEELLKVTQNDEKRFQTLIAQLKAEQESIAKAISNVQAKIGPVEKGQIIAAMGSTGCSTGPHLHFEVFENAKVEGGRIVGDRTNPKLFLDDGRFGPPLKGYPDETQITTHFGEVYYIFKSSGTAHTGLDIAPKKYEGTGRAILAVEKGIAYTTSAPCSYNIAGGSSIGKGVIIDHQNGLVTLYWHIL